jgi:hypothetical protein
VWGFGARGPQVDRGVAGGHDTLVDDFFPAAEALLEQMISQQRAKVLRLAREAVPNIGPEDVLNPHDFPELKAHPTFEFEDGLLSGLVAAQVALRAEHRRRTVP